MSSAVFVLGGFQTDFARHLAREGHDVGELVRETVEGTLAAARLEARDVDTIHVGNAFGELFNGQAHLGAMPATVVPALIGTPAGRHEAACASGSIAALAAMAELEAGRYGCALVLGVEQERNVPGDVAARHMGSAAWIGHEGQECRYLWPAMFARVGDAYDARFGLRRDHLVHLAKNAFANARKNPLAQTRGWKLEDASFGEDDAANPPVEGRLRRQDCAQVTDGAAGVILASAEVARAWAAKRGVALDRIPRITGWGHTTAGLALAPKLEASGGGDGYMLPHLRRALTDAWRRAGVADARRLDGIEVHDCFSVTGYAAIDHLGLAAPGQGWRAIEDGTIDAGGALPVNPSGGLMGVGHPVGATGVRMLVDAAAQVAGTAGGTQVDGAHTFGTLNLGGSAATVVSFVLATEERA